jgi:hypothetical protein
MCRSEAEGGAFRHGVSRPDIIASRGTDSSRQLAVAPGLAACAVADDALSLQVLAALGAVPDVGDRFQVEGLQSTEYYVVTSWLRRRPPRKPNLDPLVEEMLRDLQKKYPQRGAGPDQVPLEWCSREQAEYVSARGVGGTIVRACDVVVTGHIENDHVASERDHANLLAGEPLV